MIITKNNFKSPHIYVFYILFGLMALGLIGTAIYTSITELLYIPVGILVFLGILFMIGFKTKIHIDKNGITQKSLTKEYHIDWKDIKTHAVYRVNRYKLNIVKPEDYDKFSALGQKFIYISTQKDCYPKRNEKSSDDYIDFHWRPEAWEQIVGSILKDA